MSSKAFAPRFSLIEVDAARELASFAEAVQAGLTAFPKTLPCRFLYDETGSEIFEQICELPEYYLTRAEHEILERSADEIAACFDAPITLAELGSGSSSKTRLLIDALLRAHGRLRYVPVDISREMLATSSLELLDRYDSLEVRAIASEYQEGLRHVHAEQGRPKLVAWLGSSIGNLRRAEATRFVAGVSHGLHPRDRLLLGIDLRKDARQLEAAYDDDDGVTARFSLNLLARINRELDADFDLDGFRHQARYLDEEGRVKIQLVSQRSQRVAIPALDLHVPFRAGEGIHTEDAFKYSLAEIDALAHASGLEVQGRWLDRRQRFSLSLLAPR